MPDKKVIERLTVLIWGCGLSGLSHTYLLQYVTIPHIITAILLILLINRLDVLFYCFAMGYFMCFIVQDYRMTELARFIMIMFVIFSEGLFLYLMTDESTQDELDSL